MAKCERCGATILLDDWEVARELCLRCTEKLEEARQEVAERMGEYKQAKGEGYDCNS
jgi:exonuclease VII small subunit